LTNRLNIVITKNNNYNLAKKNILTFPSLGLAYKYLRKEDYSKVFICGGTSIYNIAIRNADEMIISKMDFEVEGNKKFPKINNKRWEIYKKEKCDKFIVYYYKRIKINKN